MLKVSGSASGAEAEVLSRQIARFEAEHPDIQVVSQPVPEGADERHQLYVQWLNAGVREPDILQLDVIWAQEFAAAGWLAKMPGAGDELGDFLPAARESATFRDAVYGRPWFVDVGMLYYRKDWFSAPPTTFAELVASATSAQQNRGAAYGFVFQGARYEGLVTNFVEVLGGFGGSILEGSGNVVVDSEAGRRALTWMYDAIHVSGISPAAVLSFQEEQARFAFESGQAAFMRNWPYAYALLQNDPGSEVRGKVGIAPMPHGAGGQPTATLGGQLLAINASTSQPALARTFIDFLCAPAQMLERARVAGQLPARRSVYLDPRLRAALPFEPSEILRVVEHATARPLSPAYTELSQELQLELHRALTDQATPRAALGAAAGRLRQILLRSGLVSAVPAPVAAARNGRRALWLVLAIGLISALAVGVTLSRRAPKPRPPPLARHQPVAYALLAPALLVIATLAVAPLGLSFIESLHAHDLRRPWLGRPFVGLSNYGELLTSERFWGALTRTLGFTLVSVTLELGFGLGLALLLRRNFRGRGLVRAVSLVPWAMPTVVVALAFRFLFDARVGPVALLAARLGVTASGTNWFSHELLAWVPIVLSDVWKSSPFVALLLLAGLSNIPPALYEAAAVDGASPLRQLFSITLPMVRALILVVLLFRALDAVRVFDLIYVLTQGGPGVATEPIALYIYAVLLQNLDFGKGAALSILVFLITLGLCFAYARLVAEREARARP